MNNCAAFSWLELAAACTLLSVLCLLLAYAMDLHAIAKHNREDAR